MRLVVSASALVLAMAGLVARLTFLHLGQHDRERESQMNLRTLKRAINPGRGTIYDRHGRHNILAGNLVTKDICVNPALVAKVGNARELTVGLCDRLDLAPDVVAVRLKRENRECEVLKARASMEEAALVENMKLDGVFFRDQQARYYPLGRMLCHVLGFVNHEGAGSAGVEQTMNRYLKGSPGEVEGRLDACRREIYTRRSVEIPAVDGADIHLTVDQDVQFIAERAVDAAMEQHHAKGVWTIVQRVATGEILAMASRPAFDLNQFQESGENARLNRAIGSVYEPGSTMKIVTFAAAIEERIAKVDRVISCENGTWSYGGRPLRDFHPYGLLTVADGLKKSSNIMTAKLAVELGDRRLERYLRRFGFGAAQDCGLPGEETGILHPVKQWSVISPTRIAIGQGVAVTALQMLNAYCTIANDGCRMRPYVVERVVAANGMTVLHNRPVVVDRPISPETATTMRQMLARVTEPGGTGRRAQVEGYAVAGKTGTAQKPIPGGYSDKDNVASFVGFLPADAPEIGIIVVVDEPQPLHTGGAVAAPVFAEMAGQIVRCLDIPPARLQMASL